VSDADAILLCGSRVFSRQPPSLAPPSFHFHSMPPKRRLQQDIASHPITKRVTRSTSQTLLPPPPSPPRKRRRVAKPGDESLPLPSKKPRGLPKAKNAHDGNLDMEQPRLEQQQESMLNGRAQSVASNASSGTRIVFDAVEIPMHRKTISRELNSSEGPGDSTTLRESSELNLKKMATRPQPTVQKRGKRKKASAPILDDNDGPGTEVLPENLSLDQSTYLNLQKRAVLRAFANPSFDYNELRGDEDLGPIANETAKQQLCDLMGGSIERGEGNSCLVIGPPGSGKSKVRFINYLSRLAAQKFAHVVRYLNWF
jgi:hypothetical protein